MDLSKAGKPSNTQTKLHKKVQDIIRFAGFTYEEEYAVEGTRYTLDFYLPEFHIGVEADGPWHVAAKDEIRDSRIKDAQGIIIFRIPEKATILSIRFNTIDKLIEFCDSAWATMEERKRLSRE